MSIEEGDRWGRTTISHEKGKGNDRCFLTNVHSERTDTSYCRRRHLITSELALQSLRCETRLEILQRLFFRKQLVLLLADLLLHFELDLVYVTSPSGESMSHCKSR